MVQCPPRRHPHLQPSPTALSCPHHPQLQHCTDATAPMSPAACSPHSPTPSAVAVSRCCNPAPVPCAGVVLPAGAAPDRGRRELPVHHTPRPPPPHDHHRPEPQQTLQQFPAAAATAALPTRAAPTGASHSPQVTACHKHACTPEYASEAHVHTHTHTHSHNTSDVRSEGQPPRVLCVLASSQASLKQHARKWHHNLNKPRIHLWTTSGPAY